MVAVRKIYRKDKKSVGSRRLETKPTPDISQKAGVSPILAKVKQQLTHRPHLSGQALKERLKFNRKRTEMTKAEASSRRKIWVRKFAKALAILMAIGILGVAGLFVYFAKDLPDPGKMSSRTVSQSTKIYDRTGQVLLYEIHGDEKRTVVKLDQISPFLTKGVVATEDKKFYQHVGVDPKGIARSIYKDIVQRQKAQGGSTITQQLVKNSILTSEKSYQRKIKEIILALEMEQKFSKDQILEMYLNQIPYGSNIYGAEAASQTFFGKPVKDIDLAEAAMLAAIPQAATRYFPYGSHPDELEARRKFVLDQMLEEKFITQEEAESAKQVDMKTRLKPLKDFEQNLKAPHFVMYIKQVLVDKFGQDTVERGGLKVQTTLSWDMQQIGEEVVRTGVEANMKKYQATNAALTAIDPKTGQILTMVGSKDYFDMENDGNMNVAISENRQPGSSFKPFVYATAFKKGYTPNTILWDVPTNFGADGSGKNFEPKNSNLSYSGPVTMRSSLARSLNVTAVKTLYLAGIPDSLQTARDLGITTVEGDNFGLSLVLGTARARLLDMTGAYSVFAADGKRHDITGILKVEDSSGKVLEEYKDNPKQVLDEQVARNINSILSDNVARTPTFGARSNLYFSDRPVAAKTGTTSDYKDAWTLGYTPDLAAGVWAGNNSGKVMNEGGGVFAASPIWNEFMTRVMKGWAVEKFKEPEPIRTDKPVLNGQAGGAVKVIIDKACGDKLAGDQTPEDQKEERTYTGAAHSILYYVDKNNPRGPVPKNPKSDPQFNNWESAVLNWARTHGGSDGQIAPTEVCDRSALDRPVVTITAPAAGQSITDGKVTVQTSASSNIGVKSVEIYFDDSLLKTASSEPYGGTFRLNGDINDGKHTITVKAYDNNGNSGSSSVSVNVGSSGSSGDFSAFLNPINENALPINLTVSASGGGIKRVDFFYQPPSGSQKTIGSVTQGHGGEYSITWSSVAGGSGRYKVFATVVGTSGQSSSTNARYVEIP